MEESRMVQRLRGRLEQVRAAALQDSMRGEEKIARACVQLADALAGEYESRAEAARLYREAYGTYSQIAGTEADRVEPMLAEICTALGRLLTGEVPEEAEEMSRLGVRYYRSLTEKAPDRYGKKFAMALYKFAQQLHSEHGAGLPEMEEAAELFARYQMGVTYEALVKQTAEEWKKG